MGWRGRIQAWLETFLRRHAAPVLLLTGALGLGIVAGALMAASVPGADRLALAGDIQQLISGEAAPGWGALFRVSLLRNLRLAGLLWLLGVTVVGFVGVPVLMFWRGLVSGFAVAVLIDLLGWQGLVLTLAVIAPHGLIGLGALLLGGTAALLFSLGLWRRQPGQVSRGLAQFTGQVAAVALAFVVAACLEAALGVAMTRLATRLF